MKYVGYKIVTQNNRSISIFPETILQYELNKKIYHRLGAGALAVFDTFENANYFIINRYFGDNYKIFKVEYKPEKHSLLRHFFHIIINTWSEASQSKVSQYEYIMYESFCSCRSYSKQIAFDKLKTLYSSYGNIEYQQGTIFARWVKLLEEVKSS